MEVSHLSICRYNVVVCVCFVICCDFEWKMRKMRMRSTTYVPTYHTYKKGPPKIGAPQMPQLNSTQLNSTQRNSTQRNSTQNTTQFTAAHHNNSSADSNNSTMDQRCPILSSTSKPLFFILAESISVSLSWKQQI